MRAHSKTLLPLLVGLGAAACGGATVEERTSVSSPYSENGGATPVPTEYLVDGEFTTEVDAATMTSAAPVSTEFLPDTEEMFFLGKLEGVPPESEIEVRWTRATQGEPFNMTRSSGSGSFTVLSRFSPKMEELDPGTYWVVVDVNGQFGGKRSFRITNRRGGAMLSVKELKVGLSVDEKARVVSPSESLPKGSQKLYASFYVNGIEQGATIRVVWYRDDNLIEEVDLESAGEKRYNAVLERKKPLPIGEYAVEVELQGEMFSRKAFYVGDSSGSPVIDQAGLGTKLGKKQTPQPKRTSFFPGTRVIKCGIQFAFVPDGAKVQVKWVSLVDGESELHVSEATIKHGGAASVGLSWNPGKKLVKGPYKALIVVNDVTRHELPFTVK